MNGIRNVVAFLEHEVLLCKAGLHPDQLDNLTEELDRARKEQWRQFEEGLRVEQNPCGEKRGELPPNPSFFVARGYDEWMDQHGNWHAQDPEVRQ